MDEGVDVTMEVAVAELTAVVVSEQGDPRNTSSLESCTGDGCKPVGVLAWTGGVGVRVDVHRGEIVLRFGSERRAFLHAAAPVTSGLDVMPSRPVSPAG